MLLIFSCLVIIRHFLLYFCFPYSPLYLHSSLIFPIKKVISVNAVNMDALKAPMYLHNNLHFSSHAELSFLGMS